MPVRKLCRFAIAAMFAATCASVPLDAHADGKRVAVILTGIEELPGLPPTGNYLREVAHPVVALEKAGFEVDFVTPDGEPALVRGNVAYGLANDVPGDPVLASFVKTRLRDDLLAVRIAPSALKPAEYCGVFYVGSLGGLQDVATDRRIARFASDVHARGGVLAASGHGIAGLAGLRTKDGAPFLRGRRVAPFKVSEDIAFFRDHLGWKGLLPYHVEDRIRETGAVIASGEDYSVTVVADDRVVTGQNAGSVGKLMEAVVAELAKAPCDAAVAD